MNQNKDKNPEDTVLPSLDDDDDENEPNNDVTDPGDDQNKNDTFVPPEI